MSTENKNQPAFPQEICNDGGNPPFKGLTKREYFAAMAMQGILANSPDWDYEQRNLDWVSKASTDFADALLHQLKLPQ